MNNPPPPPYSAPSLSMWQLTEECASQKDDIVFKDRKIERRDQHIELLQRQVEQHHVEIERQRVEIERQRVEIEQYRVENEQYRTENDQYRVENEQQLVEIQQQCIENARLVGKLETASLESADPTPQDGRLANVLFTRNASTGERGHTLFGMASSRTDDRSSFGDQPPPSKKARLDTKRPPLQSSSPMQFPFLAEAPANSISIVVGVEQTTDPSVVPTSIWHKLD